LLLLLFIVITPDEGETKDGDANKNNEENVEHTSSSPGDMQEEADKESPKTIDDETPPDQTKQSERIASTKGLQKAFSYYDIKVVCALFIYLLFDSLHTIFI